MIFNGSAVQQLAAEMTLAEKGISSAKVILTGFVVVFAVLLLLIGVIKLYSMIIGKAQNAVDHRKRRQKEPVKAVKTPPESEPKPSAAPVVQDDGIPEEVVAVIAAAVETMYGKPGRARIKSIKRVGGRSAWANAGVRDNTRPF